MSVSDTDETPPLTRKSLRESAGTRDNQRLGHLATSCTLESRKACTKSGPVQNQLWNAKKETRWYARLKDIVHHCGVSTPHTNKRATIRPSKAHEDDVPDQRDSSVIATGTITRYGLVNSQVLSAFPEDTERRQPFAVFEDDIEIVSMGLQVCVVEVVLDPWEAVRSEGGHFAVGASTLEVWMPGR